MQPSAGLVSAELASAELVSVESGGPAALLKEEPLAFAFYRERPTLSASGADETGRGSGRGVIEADGFWRTALRARAFGSGHPAFRFKSLLKEAPDGAGRARGWPGGILSSSKHDPWIFFPSDL